MIFKTFLKDKEKIVNALQLPYSNAKLETTNNLIKLIKRNAFGFRNFDNFKKRIFIALNIKIERTTIALSRCQLLFNPLQLTKSQYIWKYTTVLYQLIFIPLFIYFLKSQSQKHSLTLSIKRIYLCRDLYHILFFRQMYHFRNTSSSDM